MISFENTSAFLLLILIPILFLLRHFKILRKISFPVVISDWNGSSYSLDKRFRAVVSFIINFLMILGYVVIVAALAEPSKHQQEKIYTSRGADIVYVLDISPSMASKDIGTVNRLESAKDAIKVLCKNDLGDAVGLVAMAETASLILPPTMDRNAFEERLDSIKIGELGDGTAIGNGLMCAIYHLEKSNAKKKAVVLITDGENNCGEIHPLTAAAFAKSKNISFYILGIGTKGHVPLEYVDPKTKKVYSGYFDSNFDSTALLKIATEASGKYYEAESFSALNQSLVSISSDENVVQTYHIKNTDVLYFDKLISIAMIIFALAWFLRRIFLKEIL